MNPTKKITILKIAIIEESEPYQAIIYANNISRAELTYETKSPSVLFIDLKIINQMN